VRFDDSLKTVLAADVSTAFGARAAFRQLVDLAGRRRISVDDALIDRLTQLRPLVDKPVRVATARGLALAEPALELVQFFAGDEPDVASAVLRAARLSPEDWEALMPRLGPHGRSVLRRRDDLPPSVTRLLDSFGSTDFALGHDPVAANDAVEPAPLLLEDVVPPVAPQPESERFEIAELVHRIESFQRTRGHAAPPPVAQPVVAFRFETDASGDIRWVDTGPRGAVIGLSLRHGDRGEAPCVDGVAAGAFRQRAAFADARLVVQGVSGLGGDWRISGVPVFDRATGGFVGFRGSARRPRVEENAAPLRATASVRQTEGLRRLVHELRTPTNAISGFAELIEQEMLGPVAPAYRDRAGSIRRHVNGLIGAIDDLDLAARIEGDALHLRPGMVPVSPLLARVAHELAPLAALRHSALVLPPATDLAWAADDRAVERLVSRLFAILLSASGREEILHVDIDAVDESVALTLQRPDALAGRSEEALLSHDDELASVEEGAPLLGLGFALRLARHLAAELGGRVTIATDRLTLTLPAAREAGLEQASTTAP
jgi:signal transduction histidine kinase